MEYNHKWGFGCAPLKPEVLSKRRRSVQSIKYFIQSACLPTSETIVSDISEVKGLFNRCARQDQWDWFTVWSMLGRPGRRKCARIAEGLTHTRIACKDNDSALLLRAVDMLKTANFENHLNAFLSGGMVGFEGGQVYILSTRETPDLLKIGYTTRSIEARLNEINRGTGIAIPYGARAVWVVGDAKGIEQEIHSRLREHRIRQDREFFRMQFEAAFKIIDDYVSEAKLEV